MGSQSVKGGIRAGAITSVESISAVSNSAVTFNGDNQDGINYAHVIFFLAIMVNNCIEG